MSDLNEWLKERRRIREYALTLDERADTEDAYPALLTAVENVLELHGPVETGVSDQYWKEPDYCPTCSEYWPCETYRALKSAVEEGNTK